MKLDSFREVKCPSWHEVTSFFLSFLGVGSCCILKVLLI